MKIQLENIGKRYRNEWIFRHITASFGEGECVAIYGGNGSGKSTLLQILSGFLTPSEGGIQWEKNNSAIGIDSVYRYIALATPYMSLYDDFSLRENILFFQRFKSFRDELTEKDITGITGLEKEQDKHLRFFSSGMKQRVKLALAILSDAPVLLLDEPCSHLDEKAIGWYQDLLRHHITGRITFIASNQQHSETFLCERVVAVEEYK